MKDYFTPNCFTSPRKKEITNKLQNNPETWDDITVEFSVCTLAIGRKNSNLSFFSSLLRWKIYLLIIIYSHSSCCPPLSLHPQLLVRSPLPPCLREGTSQQQTSPFPGTSSLMRIECIFAYWHQTRQPCYICAIGLRPACMCSWLVLQPLGAPWGPD